MDVIELFVVLCTVVLLCSWAFMIYSNWKGKSQVVRFPPYGFDECPIGYRLDESGSNCTSKDQLGKVYNDIPTNVPANSAAHSKLTSKNVCTFFEEYKDKGTLAWDGLPTKSTYKDPQASKVRKILDNCCTAGGNTCSSLDFSRIIGADDKDVLG
jgi:hypothetical protein